MSSTHARTIAVDFDDTIAYCNADNDYEITGIIDGAAEALKELKRRGFNIVIHTCRALDQYKHTLPKVEAFLEHYGIEYSFITAQKPVSSIYIDNRAVNFSGSWASILALLPRSASIHNSLEDTYDIPSQILAGPQRIIQALYEDFSTIGSFTIDIPDDTEDEWKEVVIKVQCKK